MELWANGTALCADTGVRCQVRPVVLAQPVCKLEIIHPHTVLCGEGPTPIHTFWGARKEQCSQSLDCRARGHGPALPGFLLGLPPRDTGETCECTLFIHTRGREPERKTKQNPAWQLLLGMAPPWMHLPLLSSLPSPPAPAGARSGHTQLSFWLSGVYISLLLLSHPQKVSLGKPVASWAYSQVLVKGIKGMWMEKEEKVRLGNWTKETHFPEPWVRIRTLELQNHLWHFRPCMLLRKLLSPFGLQFRVFHETHFA